MEDFNIFLNKLFFWEWDEKICTHTEMWKQQALQSYMLSFDKTKVYPSGQHFCVAPLATAWIARYGQWAQFLV